MKDREDTTSAALALFRDQKGTFPTVRVSALLAARLKSKSEKTRSAYARDYEHFREFVGEPDADIALAKLVTSPGDVALTVVLEFEGWLLDLGLANSTVNRRMSALRGAVQIAKDAQITTMELRVDHLDPEEDARDSRGPGMDVVRHMIAVCDCDLSPVGVRDSLLLRWMILTGLRRNEIRELMMYHVAFEGERQGIRVKQKGKRSLQLVPVTSEILTLADPWLDIRGTARGAFYCSLDRSRASKRAMFHPTALNRILLRRAVDAGFKDGKLPDGRSITPHGFRHTAITRVIRVRGLAAAQAFARHANPATTHRYLDERDQMNLEAQAFMLEEL